MKCLFRKKAPKKSCLILFFCMFLLHFPVWNQASANLLEAISGSVSHLGEQLQLSGPLYFIGITVSINNIAKAITVVYRLISSLYKV